MKISRHCSTAVAFAAVAILVSADARGQSPPVLRCPTTTVTEIAVSATGATYRAVTDASTGSAFFATGQNADILVSGIDFDSTGGSQLFNHPAGIASDGTKVAITDTFNNRVLIWNTPPTSNVAPDVVLGQANFTTNNPGTGRNQMNWPVSVSIGGGKLFVTDTYNHRILIWNSIPTTNGTAADVIISALAMGTITSPWPWGVWSDGSKMVVGLASSSRVPIWTTVPTADDTPPAFALTGTDGTANRFGTPRHVFSNGTMLLVGDHNATAPGKAAGGTFVWTSFPTASSAPYSFFREDPVTPTHGPWLKGSFIDGALWGFGRAVSKWATPPASEATAPDFSLSEFDWSAGDYGGVVSAGGRLYVASGNLNSIFGFNSIPTSGATAPDFAIGSTGVCANTLSENFFIQNGVPRSNGSNLFVASGFDRKLYVWRSLPDQSNAHPDLVYRLPFEPGGMALRNSNLVLGGQRSVYIWDTLPLNSELPARQFKDTIGGTPLQSVRGVALDGSYFYVADDATDKIHVWNGLPNSNTAPAFSLNFTDPQKIVSDGTYLAVTSLYTHQVMIYAVSGLSASSVPVATLGGNGMFNLPQDAYIGNGRLFVADTNGQRVHAWSNLATALSGAAADIVLGESSFVDRTPEIGRNKVFWPGAVDFDGRFLWLGEFKFSTRLLRFSPPCSYHQLSSTSQAFTAPGGTGSVTVSVNDAGCAWVATSNASFLTVTSGARATGGGTVGYSVSANTTGASRTGTITVAGRTFTVTQSGPTVAVFPTALRVAAGKAAASATLTSQTGAQEVTVTFAGGSPAWTATASATWLQVASGTGTGNGRFTVALVNPNDVIGASTSLTGTVTLTASGVSNSPLTIPVTLTVARPDQTQPPFGSFDTPATGASVAGSVPVTGWALDDIEVSRVEIWRDRVTGETTPVYAGSGPGNGKIFIANPFFVSGARPDVETAYGTMPRASRAGWGYLMLTQGLWNQGNGSYTLYAFAFDQEGRSATLGSKTIAVSNATAVKPFGGLDTPMYGQTVTTSFWNFGWALTPNASPSCSIPSSGVQVGIDSRPLTAVTYGDPRTDIASAFPGFSNAAGAGGAYYIDTTSLTNGTHQIGWYVVDNCGRADGIGSRFFTVINGGTTTADSNAGAMATLTAVGAAGDVSQEPVEVRRGDVVTVVDANPAGTRVVPIGQNERVEVQLPRLGRGTYTGVQVVNGARRGLPLGSSLDEGLGIFYWQPAAGFLGAYDLEFVPSHGSSIVRVRAMVGSAVQAAIDTPQAGRVSPSFVVAGWAIDQAAVAGSGIDAVHVWAYPASGSPPIFLGVAAYGDERPDIGALFGDEFRGAAYSLSVDQLAPGTYDLVVYPHSAVIGDFHGAKVVRIWTP